MNKSRQLMAAIAASGILAGNLTATMIEDFSTNYGNTPPHFNGINGSLWSYTGANIWQQSGGKACGNINENLSATLQSVPLAVGATDFLSVDVADWAHVGHEIQVWGADAGGIISPTPIGDLLYTSGPARTMITDTRGYSHVVLTAIKTSSGGYSWYSIDNVQTTSGAARTEFTNNSFENSSTGWTTSDSAWNVLSYIGGYNASEGGQYATSQVDENTTGTLTSPGISVARQYLTFDELGWSGGNVNNFSETGQNYFLLLDATLTPVARINGANNPGAGWASHAFDLSALGFSAGDTVYFKAVDGVAGGNGWIAADYIRQTGDLLASSAVPEPSTALLLSVGGWLLWRRARRG